LLTLAGLFLGAVVLGFVIWISGRKKIPP